MPVKDQKGTTIGITRRKRAGPGTPPSLPSVKAARHKAAQDMGEAIAEGLEKWFDKTQKDAKPKSRPSAPRGTEGWLEATEREWRNTFKGADALKAENSIHSFRKKLASDPDFLRRYNESRGSDYTMEEMRSQWEWARDYSKEGEGLQTALAKRRFDEFMKTNPMVDVRGGGKDRIVTIDHAWDKKLSDYLGGRGEDLLGKDFMEAQKKQALEKQMTSALVAQVGSGRMTYKFAMKSASRLSRDMGMDENTVQNLKAKLVQAMRSNKSKAHAARNINFQMERDAAIARQSENYKDMSIFAEDVSRRQAERARQELEKDYKTGKLDGDGVIAKAEGKKFLASVDAGRREKAVQAIVSGYFKDRNEVVYGEELGGIGAKYSKSYQHPTSPEQDELAGDAYQALMASDPSYRYMDNETLNGIMREKWGRVRKGMKKAGAGHRFARKDPGDFIKANAWVFDKTGVDGKALFRAVIEEDAAAIMAIKKASDAKAKNMDLKDPTPLPLSPEELKESESEGVPKTKGYWQRFKDWTGLWGKDKAEKGGGDADAGKQQSSK